MNEVKESNNKENKVLLILVILLTILLIGIIYYFVFYKKDDNKNDISSSSSSKVVSSSSSSLSSSSSSNVVSSSSNIVLSSESDNTDKQYLIEINGSKLKEKIDNKETFILVVSQTGCSHCEIFLPKIKKVATDAHLIVYDLNISDLSNREKESLDILTSVKGTPTTLFFKNGVEDKTTSRIVGSSITEIALKEKLINYGI